MKDAQVSSFVAPRSNHIDVPVAAMSICDAYILLTFQHEVACLLGQSEEQEKRASQVRSNMRCPSLRALHRLSTPYSDQLGISKNAPKNKHETRLMRAPRRARRILEDFQWHLVSGQGTFTSEVVMGSNSEPPISLNLEP